MQGPQALASTSAPISLRGSPWDGGDEGQEQEEEEEEEGEERRKGQRVKRKMEGRVREGKHEGGGEKR